jgi:ADP-ribosyl-[dinitrogen reductase] hydrolase
MPPLKPFPPALARPARFTGVVLGTAAGDALGLPAEGLRKDVIRRRWRGIWRHRLLPGMGLCSDDTEHTLMLARSLLAQPGDAAAFQRDLAWRLRGWLLLLPAGVGLATARAILRLWIGVPATRSGVFSAGNGPAMRSAVIGVFFADDAPRRRDFVLASTRLTHTDPKAAIAALAVAELAAAICTSAPPDLDPAEILRRVDPDPAWQALVARLASAHTAGLSVEAFAASLGLARGVTGYAWHTVPVAVYAWWRHRGDFRAALAAALDCGGDTDTVGAITGALAGAEVGEAGIPAEWIQGIREWPCTLPWMRRLAATLARASSSATPLRSPPYFWPGLLLRNIVFLAIVLLHAFARLIPR